MPILGLTDRALSYPLIGVIRKGAPKKEGSNKPGPDLKYFRYAPLEGEEDSAAVFAEIYPTQPRELHIVLPFQTAAENFEAWKEIWGASGLMHRCDGQTAVLWRDPQTGAMRHDPTPCKSGNVCKQVGRLRVMLPEMERLAIVTVITSSKWDIINLTENVKAIEAMRGDCRGLPLILKRRPRRIPTPEMKDGKPTGRRVRMEKWLLSLEVDPGAVARLLGAMRVDALPVEGEGLRSHRYLQPGRPDPRMLQARTTVVEGVIVGDLDFNPGSESGDDDDDDENPGEPGEQAAEPPKADPVTGEKLPTPEATPTPANGGVQPSLLPNGSANGSVEARVDAAAAKQWASAVASLAKELPGVFANPDGTYKSDLALVQAKAHAFVLITTENVGLVVKALFEWGKAQPGAQAKK